MKRINPHSMMEFTSEPTNLVRYFWISLILTIPVLLFATSIVNSLSKEITSWTPFILGTPVVVLCGWPILKAGWYSIVTLRLNMFTLIVIAIISVYMYGIVSLLFPTTIPAFESINTDSNFLFAVASSIVTIVLFEQVFERFIYKRVKAKLRVTQWDPSPIIILMHTFCRYFIFLVIIIAFLTLIFGPQLNLGFIAAISVLMIACPRAFTLAGPIAFFSGIACIEKFGARISSATCLEEIEKMEVLVLDKNSIKNQTTALAIKKLYEKNIRIVLVTEEEDSATVEIAKKLELKITETAKSPEQKMQIAKRLLQEGFAVSILNTNDRNEMTLEIITTEGAHDKNVRFMNSDLMNIVRVQQVSKEIMHNIRQNIFFSFIYNLVFIPLAAGIYFLLSGKIFNPIAAAILMCLCIALVVANALRLQKLDIDLNLQP